MGKQRKTIQSIAKRFQVTKGGKVVKLKDSKNHFNAKSSGSQKRNRRRDLTLAKTDAKVIKQII
ncbi:50S ribosomal protein L35 [Candidatus Kuenenbacteria bacterium]|nr:50S ribosomal protein L35 [Candidatus Kuenenbacteria bacterium]